MKVQPEHSDAPARQQRCDARANRQQILAAAKRLFADQGVAATSMKDIAAAAEVGKGTLYRHFAHKGDLCTTLLREDIAAFQQRLDALLGDTMAGTSALARIEILIGERVRMTETHLPLFAAIEAESDGSGRARPFRGPFESWTHAHLERLLGTAVARGEISALDIAFAADAIQAAVSPALYRYQRHECGYSVERIIIGMRQLFIERLQPSLAE